MCEISNEIEAARPEDSIGLAVQMRYPERSLAIGSIDDQIVLAGAIAAILTRLAAVDPPRRGDGRGRPEYVANDGRLTRRWKARGAGCGSPLSLAAQIG